MDTNVILIADAGATKTDWRLLAGEKVSQFKTEGYNPKVDKPEKIVDIIPEAISQDTVGKLYFYGAGIVEDTTKNTVNDSLQTQFEAAEIYVASDLQGAARALLGKEQGVACILGTGSAACFYDGQSVTKRIPSLGYILGDEGSGFYLGKQLLSTYLRKQLPSPLEEKFINEFGRINEDLVLESTYKNPGSAYISQFSSFIIYNQSDPFIYQLAYRGFELFFMSYFGDLESLKGEKIRFTGSIAHLLSNVLLKVARDKNLNVDLIAQSPIAGLTLYHQQNG